VISEAKSAVTGLIRVLTTSAIVQSWTNPKNVNGGGRKSRRSAHA
jgi:hypothetical protein